MFSAGDARALATADPPGVPPCSEGILTVSEGVVDSLSCEDAHEVSRKVSKICDVVWFVCGSRIFRKTSPAEEVVERPWRK